MNQDRLARQGQLQVIYCLRIPCLRFLWLLLSSMTPSPSILSISFLTTFCFAGDIGYNRAPSTNSMGCFSMLVVLRPFFLFFLFRLNHLRRWTSDLLRRALSQQSIFLRHHRSSTVKDICCFGLLLGLPSFLHFVFYSIKVDNRQEILKSQGEQNQEIHHIPTCNTKITNQ